MGAVINETLAPYHAYRGVRKWNSYDITFRAARFENGKRTEKAIVTLYFNGKKVHLNQQINKVWGGANSGLDGGNDNGFGITDSPGGLKLQCEGHDVRYRNIWIKELDLEKPDTDFAEPLVEPVKSDGSQPNFVIVFIDDMGYGDVEPFGSKANDTPNLNRMASEGMKLNSFYAAPVCSASRAQLLTGCYAPRVSVPGVFFPAGPKGLNPAEHTIADYLGELGYSTMCVGKWHLGDQAEFLPTNNGFDHYFGIPYSNDMQRVSAETGKRVTPLLRDDKVARLLEDEQQRDVTRDYTNEAVKYITENKNSDKPFFLYLAHTAVHIPIFPHQDFVGRSRNGVYGDWIAEVDWSVGRVLNALRETQQEKETLVIFTSDNGPWRSMGTNGGVSGPLRGSKGCTLEGGVREPTIAWWPGRVAAGKETNEIAGTTDLLPTLVSLAGGTLKETKIDGYDVSQLLLGKTNKSPRTEWFYYQGTRLKAVRSGKWKLAIERQSFGMGMKQEPEDLQLGNRLYNLDTDLGETKSVFDQHPDVVEKLRAMAEKMKEDIGSGKPGPGVRPPGVKDSPVTLYPTVPPKRRVKSRRKKVVWNKLKVGDVFTSDSVPNIAKKSFTISCRIDNSKGNGVLIAHGGTAVGYSLYLKNGEITFAARNGGDSIRRVKAKAINGTNMIEAGLSKAGIPTLTVNGMTTSMAGAASLFLPKVPQEGLSIGFDSQNAVDPSAPGGRYGGKIENIRVVTP